MISKAQLAEWHTALGTHTRHIGMLINGERTGFTTWRSAPLPAKIPCYCHICAIILTIMRWTARSTTRLASVASVVAIAVPNGRQRSFLFLNMWCRPPLAYYNIYHTFPTTSNQTTKGYTPRLGARMGRVTDCGHGERGTRTGGCATDEGRASRQMGKRGRHNLL